MNGGAGSDTLTGGDGYDFASYDAAAAAVTVDLAEASLNSGDAAGDVLIGIEAVLGSARSDTLAGDSSGNRLDGGAGDDLLQGRAGADQLYGGAGSDTLEGGAGADVLTGGDGLDFASYINATSGCLLYTSRCV